MASALPSSETHPIVLAEGSRVISTSDGLGWSNIHASVTAERRWAGSLSPINHICFAYCLRRSARIERRIAGEAAVKTLGLSPRQFGILPTRVASMFRLTGTADIMMIYIRGALVERMARDLFNMTADDGGMEPRVGFYDPFLEQVAMEIIRALDRRNTTEDPLYVDQLATAAASHLLRHHANRKDPTTSAAAGIRSQPMLQSTWIHLQTHIEDELDGDLSLTRLAREAGLSPARLTELFAAAKGETPHRYIVARRIERAKQLLISTQFSIAEIALRTGFSSQSHLSDVFKRITGETPKVFRSAGTFCDATARVR